MNRGLKPGVTHHKIPLALLATGLLLLAAVSASAQDQRPAETSFSMAFLATLSAQERAWLRDHPVITVAQDPDWPPIEFADKRGTPSGMAADYLRLVEGRLGVTFQQVKNLSWQEAYARMQRWEIDMTTSVAVTSERETFWAFTKPYMTIPLVIVTRSDVSYIADLRELEGKKVVVVAGYVAETWIARDFPEIQLVRAQTTQEALAMLQHGEVFACVENMLVVDDFIMKSRMSGLKISGSTPYNNAQSMAVRKDWAILAGILDQALDSISATERDAIFRKWLPLQYQSTFDYTRLWPVAAILALVLMGLVTWNWRLAAEIRRRRQAEEILHQSRRAALNLMTDALEARDRAEQASQSLRASEESYRTLFSGMQNGFAHSEIICDAQGRPIDSRYLAVNPAFECITGRKPEAVVGKTILEVFPALEPEWIETFGRVALTGKPVKFEMNVAELGITFSVSAFCPAPNQYAYTFSDITETKWAKENTAKQLEELLRWQDAMLDREDRVIELKKEINELAARAGKPPRYPSAVVETSNGMPDGSLPFKEAEE